MIKRFLTWYNTDDSGMMPTPSNKMYFWGGITLIVCVIIKILQSV